MRQPFVARIYDTVLLELFAFTGMSLYMYVACWVSYANVCSGLYDRCCVCLEMKNINFNTQIFGFFQF